MDLWERDVKIAFKIFQFTLISFLLSCSHNRVLREISSTPLTCAEILKSFLTENLDTSVAIDEKLLAVHLTDYIPESNTLRADSTSRPRFAPTLHFSLGQPVLKHSRGNWEDKKYGIMLPIKYLKDQMMNVFVQDTFIVGDLVLPKEAILLLPAGNRRPDSFLGRVIYYEANEKISDVVKNVIKKEKGIELDAGGPSVDNELRMNSEIIDPLVLLQPLLKSNPNVTYKSHAQTPIGKVDVLVYGILKNWFVANGKYGSGVSPLRYDRLMITEALKKVDADIAEMKIPLLSLESYKKNRIALNGYLNLIDAEIELQTNFNKTFIKEDISLRDELLQVKENPEEIKKVLMGRIDQLPSAPNNSQTNFLDAFQKDFDWVGLDDFKRIIHDNRTLVGSESEYKMEETILIKELSLLNLGKIESKEVTEQFEKTIYQARMNYEYNSIAGYLYRAPLEIRRKLLNNPKILDLLKLNLREDRFNSLCE
jgi:hypothetical protein